VDDIAGMQQIFQLMKEQDLSSDEFTMLSLIVGQLANDNLQAARDIVSSFRILGVTPSVKTYHKLFSVCKRYEFIIINIFIIILSLFLLTCITIYTNIQKPKQKQKKKKKRTHDLDAALNLWDQMREEQVEPDLPIFNALMDIYAHRGALEQVHQLLDAMKAQGLEPTPTEVACLLAVMYHRDGRVTEAGYQLVEDMRREGKVAPHLATFSPFIDILLKADKIDEAWDVRRNMMARWDIQPDKVLNRTFLFALAAKRDVDKIDELFRHMEAHPREFFPHCDSIVLLLEHWLARDPRSPRVAEVLETLQRLNVAHKLSRQVFVEPALQVIDGLIDQNSFDRARKLLRYLDPNKLETYTRLFATCRRPEHWPMLEEFWDMLMEPRRRIQPDGTVALAYLEALCRLGRTHDAVHFLHNMVHKQSFPDLEHYNLVLRHASSNDKWNFVRKVLKLMRYDRVTGDNVTAAIRERLHEVDGSLEEESAE
jgi:pentatricopeptide repeat protein